MRRHVEGPVLVVGVEGGGDAVVVLWGGGVSKRPSKARSNGPRIHTYTHIHIRQPYPPHTSTQTHV